MRERERDRKRIHERTKGEEARAPGETHKSYNRAAQQIFKRADIPWRSPAGGAATRGTFQLAAASFLERTVKSESCMFMDGRVGGQRVELREGGVTSRVGAGRGGSGCW